jgi:hypothetical protein
MNKFVFTALIGLVFNCSVIAQQNTSSTEYQEKIKVAEQIMSLAGSPLDLERVMRSIAPTTRANFEGQVKRKNPQLTQAQLNRVVDLNMEVITKNMNQFALEIFPLISSATSKAYAEKFSLGELNSIYQYQNSDVGRKAQAFTFNEMPELMKPLMAATQKMGAEAGEAFVRIQQQLAQEGIVLK